MRWIEIPRVLTHLLSFATNTYKITSTDTRSKFFGKEKKLILLFLDPKCGAEHCDYVVHGKMRHYPNWSQKTSPNQ